MDSREIYRSAHCDSSEQQQVKEPKHLCRCWATQSDQRAENNTSHHFVAPPQDDFLELNQKESKKSCFFLLSRSLWHDHSNTRSAIQSLIFHFFFSPFCLFLFWHHENHPPASLPPSLSIQRSITAVLANQTPHPPLSPHPPHPPHPPLSPALSCGATQSNLSASIFYSGAFHKTRLPLSLPFVSSYGWYCTLLSPSFSLTISGLFLVPACYDAAVL